MTYQMTEKQMEVFADLGKVQKYEHNAMNMVFDSIVGMNKASDNEDGADNLTENDKWNK